MYVSKAMLNMRGDALGSTSPSVEAPWLPSNYTAPSVATPQAAGIPTSTEVGGAIVFSTGDTIPDSVWHSISGTLFSLNTLRTLLTSTVPACVMDTALQSTGRLRIINKGQGRRTFEFADNTLGKLAYAKPFNRMYVLISTSTSTAVGTANVCSVIELTPQDLQQMGASLTDNGDGTFNLNGTIVLNNLTFS